MERAGGRIPLVMKLAALDAPEAVLAGDCASELAGDSEQVARCRLGALQRSGVIGRNQERAVEVAIPGVSPAAGAQAMPASDLSGRLHRLAQPVDRHGLFRS